MAWSISRWENVGKQRQKLWIHFFFLKSLFKQGQKHSDLLVFCWLLSHLLRYFRESYFLNYLKLLDSLLRKGWWCTSSIISNNNQNLTHYLASNIFLWEKLFNNRINVIFMLCINQFLLLNISFLFC